MTRLRLVLLNASYGVDSTSRNFRRELDADLSEFVLTKGQLPTDLDFDFDGCVVTGSKASTYWDEEWIDDAREWVAAAHERGMPILGICFGHQLLADALGGTVEGMDGYEIGYRPVTRTADDPVLAGLDDEFTVFTTHGDSVTALPEGARTIAENDYGLHGFRVGHSVGLQFHPEYDMATAESVTRGKEFLGDDRLEQVLAGITDENYARACESKRLFDNFTSYVRQVRAEANATSA